jgi:hypothetical protein
VATLGGSSNDRLWDMARGASSLIVSSLVASFNDKFSGGVLHGISSVWSLRASKLALFLDGMVTYYWYTS